MLTVTPSARLRPLSDLAASLTDRTLKLLRRAGVRGDTVEMELETWHALTDEIERAFDIGEPQSSEESFHLGARIKQAVHRAAERVASEFCPECSPTALDG